MLFILILLVPFSAARLVERSIQDIPVDVKRDILFHRGLSIRDRWAVSQTGRAWDTSNSPLFKELQTVFSEYKRKCTDKFQAKEMK